MKAILFLLLLLFSGAGVNGQTSGEEDQVLTVVERFFIALEEQDSLAFRNMFLADAPTYAVQEVKDSVHVRRYLPSGFRFKKGQIIKERMRRANTIVKIEGSVGMVWAPYDLWINQNFSHCGVDVFTLIRTSNGWKIASIAYTVQKERCN